MAQQNKRLTLGVEPSDEPMPVLDVDAIALRFPTLFPAGSAELAPAAD
jgi:hypothetical protein